MDILPCHHLLGQPCYSVIGMGAANRHQRTTLVMMADYTNRRRGSRHRHRRPRVGLPGAARLDSITDGRGRCHAGRIRATASPGGDWVLS